MSRLTIAVVAALLSVVVVTAACGGGGGGATAVPSGAYQVTMSEFKFDPTDPKVKADNGKVTFFLVNNGTVAHDMVVKGADGKTVATSELVQPGNSSTFQVSNLAPGGYQFVCDQPGHEEQGMKGTLTVTS